MYATPEQSAAWLKDRMAYLDIASLDELADLAGRTRAISPGYSDNCRVPESTRWSPSPPPSR